MVIKNLFMKLFSTQCSVEDNMQIIQERLNHLPPEDALRYLLELDNHLYFLLGQTSVRYGNGIHSKHRHINYHDFFIRNILPGEAVIDLGCGNGTCAHDIASKKPDCTITGIDINPDSISFAKHAYSLENLTFICGDITNYKFEDIFDVVILSNVLEHIEKRVPFLINIRENINPKRWLIRVPVYERDWRVPLKNELGIDYRLDPTHYIEYKKGELENELMKAGLKIEETEYGWGEIWCVVNPIEV